MKKVEIVEVGLRDGLQNEKEFVPMPFRTQMAERLADAGVTRLEVGAFVRPEKIPQMAGSKEIVLSLLRKQQQEKFPAHTAVTALVPNEIGMQEALSTGLKEIAIFASSTESFSKANINCSIEESFERFVPVMEMAKRNKVKVRGYLSVCFGCPYEGSVDPKKVVQLAKRLIKLGCYEVSMGDTIGGGSGSSEDSFHGFKASDSCEKIGRTFSRHSRNCSCKYFNGLSIGNKSIRYEPGWIGRMSLCSRKCRKRCNRRCCLYVSWDECRHGAESVEVH